ncbi:MAG: UvrD-helicase domain-containing protein [Chloroflexota bacterium]
MDILSGLNVAQREAVEAIEGPLLILAGPGSGKTRVITHRVAYLVKVCGIKPYRIMAVTFTNKAAREMSERLEQLLGGSAGELTLGTFHAICARILRQRGHEVGVDPHFVIYDDEDQLNLMKQAVLDVGLDPRRYSPRVFLAAASAAKSQLTTAAQYGERAHSYFEKLVHQAYGRYEQLLSYSKALDFDDLLVKTVQLFNERPETLAKYQSRYMHLLVDEFQDTNVAQYALTKQLAGRYRNICVVGDPDQSIYTWRQADIRNILSFENDYPDARLVVLEQSYRSTKTILEAAHRIISVNVQRKPKNLWTENEVGVPISVVQCYDEDEEAQFVVAEVERLVKEGEVSLKDCAVMYRVNAQSRPLEEALLRYGVPYRLVGGTRFYQRREVKDIIAYMRLVYNPYDGVSLRRVVNVPPRGIGPRTVDELWQWAKGKDIAVLDALELIAGRKEGVPFAGRSCRTLADFYSFVQQLVAEGRELKASDVIELVLERTGYRDYILGDEEGEERWENILELRTVARQHDHLEKRESLSAFLEGVTLVSDVDNYDERADAVTLITLHQAKGLEFPVVFIVGMEEKVFPHARSFDDPSEMEEERRLCYVGVTRAKKRVYLIRALRRSFLGSTSHNEESRFLRDIPYDLVSRVDASSRYGSSGVAWASQARDLPLPAQLDIGPGSRVRHARFGYGVVLGLSPAGTDHEVTVAFADVGPRRLLLSYARLEKVE